MTSTFEGMSRRQVILQAGFASMIALTLVSSLVAPVAAHAASLAPGSVPENFPCTMSSQLSRLPEIRSPVVL